MSESNHLPSEFKLTPHKAVHIFDGRVLVSDVAHGLDWKNIYLASEVNPLIERMRELLSRTRDLLETNEMDKETPGHDAGLCDCCDIGLAIEINEVLNDRP